MGVDVLYDNLGILSLPPQYSSTQDTPSETTAPGFAAPDFLANGGLPPGLVACRPSPAHQTHLKAGASTASTF